MRPTKILERKYTYQDWWEGRIAFGGLISFESDSERKKYEKQFKRVGWSDIKEADEKKIKIKQKEIFGKLVTKLRHSFEEDFKTRKKASSEKKIFINETLNDFNRLFYGHCPHTPNNLYHFSFLKIALETEEVGRIRNFINHQMIGGKRFYDFIQSPNQKLKCFENPPIEVLSEVLYKFYKSINGKNHQLVSSKIKNKSIKQKTKKKSGKRKVIFQKMDDTILAENRSICYDSLLNVEPPVVDKRFNYNLGERQKGAIVAWCDALKKKGKISNIKDNELAKLLNKKIRNLNLSNDGRTLRN